ncbi:hypothetical protein PROFUN_04661 [Planoprotostelium fungivorum]|uniref:SMP-LTD domain-containing protein n=1 Tax=Planoprotostelium fungivorum TaxID=1890364 RepID=A0A2P6NUI8_9EUKA|nr:hypothetical protein PROFUN_04661 [Planoprotostelium fungivorum]
MIFFAFLYQIISNFLFYSFIFILGGLTFLAATAYIVLSRVSGTLKDIENEYVDLVLQKSADLAGVLKEKEDREKKADQQLSSPVIPIASHPGTAVNHSLSPNGEDHPGKYVPKNWFKILRKPPTEYPEKSKEQPAEFKVWHWAVLRNNMLFQFQDDKAEACLKPFCLDGCTVTTGQLKKNGRPLWRNTNWIILSHPTRDMLPDTKTVHLVFKQAKDLEEWYLLLTKAAKLGGAPTEAEKHQRKFWSTMAETLNNHETDHSPHWLTAIFCRIMWRIHDSAGFREFLMEKFQKKLNKIDKPSIVKRIMITDVYFGPNLPIFNSVKLLRVTEHGDLDVDTDFVYPGGFHLSVEADFEIPLAIRKFTFPVVLSIEVKRIAGQAHIHFSAPPSSKFWLGFYNEPSVEVEVKTEIGEHKYEVLGNIPALAKAIVNKIKIEILQSMVLPNMDDWPIPKIDENNKVKLAGTTITMETKGATKEDSPQLSPLSIHKDASKEIAAEVDSYIGYYSPDLDGQPTRRGSKISKFPPAVELTDFSKKSSTMKKTT